MLTFLQKLCNNNEYHIVYFILYVYGEDNTKLKKLCLILLSLFRQYNMFKQRTITDIKKKVIYILWLGDIKLTLSGFHVSQ
jgi:hypothetical protein